MQFFHVNVPFIFSTCDVMLLKSIHQLSIGSWSCIWNNIFCCMLFVIFALSICTVEWSLLVSKSTTFYQSPCCSIAWNLFYQPSPNICVVSLLLLQSNPNSSINQCFALDFLHNPLFPLLCYSSTYVLILTLLFLSFSCFILFPLSFSCFEVEV